MTDPHRPSTPLSPQDIAGGQRLSGPIPNTSGDVMWANDNATLVGGGSVGGCVGARLGWGRMKPFYLQTLCHHQLHSVLISLTPRVQTPIRSSTP
jgi:hypothetical protein